MENLDVFFRNYYSFIMIVWLAVPLSAVLLLAIAVRRLRNIRKLFVTGLSSNHNYGNIAAVLSYLHQLDELDEEAQKRLASYPDKVIAAARHHYVELLASDLEKAQLALSRAHNGDDWTVLVKQSELIEDRQEHVDLLFTKLTAAVQLNGHHA